MGDLELEFNEVVAGCVLAVFTFWVVVGWAWAWLIAVWDDGSTPHPEAYT